MDFKTKIVELQKKIYDTIVPLITNDYIFLALPYHANIGDILIWEGEHTFLKSLPYNCLGTSSKDSWRHIRLQEDTIILIHGGGNFGDLYRSEQEFKLELIKRYPHNRIIMFPQSIWYDDYSLIENDAKCMACHKDLHLIARDRWSYNFLERYFKSNNIYLLPDMAFCINNYIFNKFISRSESRKKLYLRRLDNEITKNTPQFITKDVEIHDWPTFEKTSIRFKFIGAFLKLQRILPSYRLKIIFGKFIDWYADSFIREKMTIKGAKFISSYECIITTRLHGLILSFLLHKNIEYIDSKSRKLSAYVDTWLDDVDKVTKI